MSSDESWKKPPIDTFKMKFNGAIKGNPGPAGYGRAIRDPQGRILSFYSGSLISCSNNLAKLEGLLNGVAWGIQNTPLIVEGG